MNIVTDIIAAAVKVTGALTTPIVGYFQRKAEIAAEDRQQERALKRAEIDRRIELISKGLTADMNWEMEFARQAASSWKDEYTLLVVSVPALLAFIPKDMDEWQGGAYYVTEGFRALRETPGWYQLLLVSLFFATFGIRYFRRNQSDT